MPGSANSPETAANSAETREPTQPQIDQVAALLRGEEPDQDDQDKDARAADQDNQETDSDSDASSETDKSKGKPKNLEALAETLGLEAKDLYAMEIPFSVGDDVETKTLGEIKDQLAEVENFEVDRLAWEEQKTQRENDLVKSTQELQEIISLLPKSAISDQLVERVARRRAEIQTTEARLTKQVIPEWSSEDVETKDRTAMREHLSEYGFPENYLDSLIDHRTLRYIRESMLRQQRIERALEQVKTVRKPGHKPSGKPSEKPRGKPDGRPASRVRSQVQQVADLLKAG